MNAPSPLEEIFFAALQKGSPAELAAYLDEACAADLDLREHVEKMLAAQAQAGSFLEVPVGELGKTVDQPPLACPGTQIGPYKLLQQIGEGGMGVVYMAEQKEPVERQALAMMDHPNIAKVLDAGATESGRPYFVMELVKGVPITQYCDEHQLTPKERLELFLPVLQAVQHAHQKGIIHRDIKPNNVLVAEYDNRPVPKVIDFGVAKATSQKLTEKTMFTQYGQLVGTVDYMSPEQAKLNQMDIDTRSDIYSLGVLLYELLTGDTPFDRQRLRSAAFEEMMRIIREEEPPKPSTRLSSSEMLPSVSAHRNTEPRKLSALVRGELDWIVMRAMDKDRARRYETADGFAADLQRYLNDEPVQACPPSAAYRLRKYVRRHRAGIAVLTMFATTLLMGTAVSVWLAIRATKAESLAQERLQTEVQQSRLAQNNAREADTQRHQAEDARQQADAHRERAERNFQKAREAVDQMLTRVADSLIDVPQLDQVRRELLEDALRFYQELLKEKNSDPSIRAAVARAFSRLGFIYKRYGHYAEAEQKAAQAVELFQQLASEYPAKPEYRRELAFNKLRFVNVLSNLARAEEEARQAVELYQSLDAEFPKDLQFAADVASAYTFLGQILGKSARWPEAEQAYRQAIFFKEKLTGTHETVQHRLSHAGCLRNLGVALQRTARVQEAEHVCRQAVAINRQVIADSADEEVTPRQDLGYSLNILGGVLAAADNMEVAEASYYEAVALFEQIVTDFPTFSFYRGRLAEYLNSLARVLQSRGRNTDAEPVFRRAIQFYERLVTDFPENENYPRGLESCRSSLASLYQKMGQTAQAEQVFLEAIAFYERLAEQFPERSGEHRTVAEAHFALGRILWTAGRSPDAEDQYQIGLKIEERSAQEVAISADRRLNWSERHLELGHAMAAAGRAEQAEEAYRQALAITEQDPTAWEHLGGHTNNLGVFLAATGKFEEAEQLFRKSLEFRQKVVERTPERPYSRQELAGSYYNLGLMLDASGRPAEAEQALREALSLQEKLVNEVPTQGMEHGHGGGARVHAGLSSMNIPGRHFHHVTLANTLDHLAGLAKKRGEAAEAQRLLEQAIDNHQSALESNPTDPHYRRYLLSHYARTIQHLIRSHHVDDAQPEQQVTQRGLPDVWEDYYRAAGALAGCASDVAIDDDVVQVEAQAWAQVHTEQDRELLKRVFRRGGRRPATPLEQNNLAWLLATHPVSEVRDPQRAIELAKQAVAGVPEQAPSWNTLGVACYRNGDWKPAIESLEKAESLAPGQSQAFNGFFLAMAHWQRGEKDEARTWYDQAVAWMEQNNPADVELLRFRQEAAELLGVAKLTNKIETPSAP